MTTNTAFLAGGCFWGLEDLIRLLPVAVPGLQFLSNEQYSQLFTMWGSVMLLFYATPIMFGFANLVLPLQIGAPDVAFPRLNAFSFWLFLFVALIALGGFLASGAARHLLDGTSTQSDRQDASTLTAKRRSATPT